MSWTAIRPYFQGILDAQELREWEDAFAIDNIPADILDGSYYIGLNEFLGDSLNQKDQETRTTVRVKVFLKGFGNPIAARDAAIELGETIASEALRPSKRLIHPIKNVLFNSMTIQPFGVTNDNVVFMELIFTMRIILTIPQ